MDPGIVPPLVFKCLNAHTERLWAAMPERRGGPVVRRCAVCGIDLPGGYTGKTCSPEHARFVVMKRQEAQAAHYRAVRGLAEFVPFSFWLEVQDWYRGAATAFQPPPRPRWPLFPDVPADWLTGFRVAYPPLERPEVTPGPAQFARPEEDIQLEARLRQRRVRYTPREPGPRTIVAPRSEYIGPFPPHELPRDR